MFEIISLGRVDFLLAVLNGLAILTADDGPAGYGGLAALGLIIGVLLALLRGVVTQRLELQWVLAGWLLFACLFVPKVTVTVEDIYTGETTTVANVPLGPAAIGSITSTVGVTLADAFGTVFAVPSLTTTGYMDALEIINSMRTMDYGPANDGDAANAVSGVDLQRSMRAYLIDCVYYDMGMDLPAHDVTAAELRESTDLLSAVQVNSNTWFTTVFLIANDEDGQTLTCAEAYDELSTFVRSRFLPAWETYIASLLGLTDTSTQMQDALDAIFGVGHDARTYMLNALIKRELELAEVGYHAQADNPAGVMMRVQAMEQRRTQWAAEQSLWAEMARPAIAFVEGFFYAVSPFMAFLFTLGAPGIALFGRYLLLAVWIQLWMPVLAVTNLYITIAASSDLQRIGAGGTDLLTTVGLDSVWTETASWLAFGGSMVAATPLLTLILITGSYFALTRLTDRLAGADHVDERIQSPDIMSPAAVAAAGAMGMQTPSYTSDPVHGLHATGVPAMLPSVNLTSDVRSNLQSARSAQQQAQQEWTSSISTGLDLSHQRNREQFTSNLHSTGISGTFSQADAVIERMARSAVQNDNVFRSLTQDERDTLHAAIGVALQSGGSAAGHARVSQTLENMRSITDSQRKEIGERIERLADSSSNETAQLAEKIQEDASNGVSSRFFSAMGVADAKRWSESHKALRSASETAEHATSLSESAGLRQDLKLQAIGYQSSQQGWSDELMKLVSTHRLNMERVEDNAGFWSRHGWMDHETALASAAALELASGSHSSRVALAETLAAHHFGSPTLESEPATPRGGLVDAVTKMTRDPEDSFASPRSFDEASSDVAREVEHVGFDSNGAKLRSEVENNISGSEHLEEQGRLAAQRFFEAKKAGNAERVQEALADLDRIVTAQRAGHYESTYEETRGFLKAVQDFDIAGQFGDVSINSNALKEASNAFTDAQNKALAAGSDARSALVAGLSASFRGYGKGFTEAVEERRDKAYDEAISLGFPIAAAQFYANQHVLWQEDITDAVPKMVGKDSEFERERLEARELLGDKALSMLSRAATAEPVAKHFYLDGALSIYQQRSKGEVPLAEPAHR